MLSRKHLRRDADRVRALEVTLHDVRTWLVDMGADNRRPGLLRADDGAMQVLYGVEEALGVDADDPLWATHEDGVWREV
jgi:hypothetical protein